MTQDFSNLYPPHVSEVQHRWELALSEEGFDAIVVHSGTPMFSFQDDYQYAFRPNPHFLAWLPLTHHNDSVLLVRPGEQPVLLYFQPDDYWHLPPADPESWWADHYDIRVVRGAEDWKDEVKNILSRCSVSLDRVAVIGDAPSLSAVFEPGQINPAGLTHRLKLARTRKTPYEVACMQEASRLAARAHKEAEKAFRQGEDELSIHQRYLESCGQVDADLPYGSIVALNEHGAVLHYQARSSIPPVENRSFLIDAGCSVNAYASDITRTYAAAPGVFADMIAAMNTMQLALIDEVKEGLDYRQLHLKTHAEIARILVDFDLVTSSADETVSSGLSSVFYPHGLGHFIGLQTHDVAGLVDDDGEPIERPEGHPYLRLTRVLEAGNVLTVEPGLYFIEPLLRRWRDTPEAWMVNWGRVESLRGYGGIRIEDNVLVTDSGCDNLTRRAFSELV